jgi:hypothetical protein
VISISSNESDKFRGGYKKDEIRKIKESASDFEGKIHRAYPKKVVLSDHPQQDESRISK